MIKHYCLFFILLHNLVQGGNNYNYYLSEYQDMQLPYQNMQYQNDPHNTQEWINFFLEKINSLETTMNNFFSNNQKIINIHDTIIKENTDLRNQIAFLTNKLNNMENTHNQQNSFLTDFQQTMEKERESLIEIINDLNNTCKKLDTDNTKNKKDITNFRQFCVDILKRINKNSETERLEALETKITQLQQQLDQKQNSWKPLYPYNISKN